MADTNRSFMKPKSQGEDEQINYFFYTTPWGTNPTGVSVKVFDVTNAETKANWMDVTTTVMPANLPAVTGNKITLSKLQSLVDGHVYRIEVKFSVSELGDCEAYGFIMAGE